MKNMPMTPPMIPIFSNVAGKARIPPLKKADSMLKNVCMLVASPGPANSERDIIEFLCGPNSSKSARLNFFARYEAYENISDFAPK